MHVHHLKSPTLRSYVFSNDQRDVALDIAWLFLDSHRFYKLQVDDDSNCILTYGVQDMGFFYKSLENHQHTLRPL